MSGIVYDPLIVAQTANSGLVPNQGWTPASTRSLTSSSSQNMIFISSTSGLNVRMGNSGQVSLIYNLSSPTNLNSLQSIMLNASSNVSVSVTSINLTITSTLGTATISSVKIGDTFFIWNVSDISADVMALVTGLTITFNQPNTSGIFYVLQSLPRGQIFNPSTNRKVRCIQPKPCIKCDRCDDGCDGCGKEYLRPVFSPNSIYSARYRYQVPYYSFNTGCCSCDKTCDKICATFCDKKCKGCARKCTSYKYFAKKQT